MREVIKQFKPSMNDYIELPYDYKKENPKAKKSEYPNLTGYTALHIGKYKYKLKSKREKKTYA